MPVFLSGSFSSHFCSMETGVAERRTVYNRKEGIESI